jgi:hypothetical protein
MAGRPLDCDDMQTLSYAHDAQCSGRPMRCLIALSLCFAVLGSLLTAAAEQEVPKFDVAVTCRVSNALQTPATCIQNEQAARDRLAKSWRQFKRSDISRCIQIETDRAAAASYVELLTCLQAAGIDEKTPTDPFGPLPQIEK